MDLKTIIKYNKATFITGSWFIKIWMLTSPILAGYIVSQTLTADGWPMAVLSIGFVLGSYGANALSVKNYLNTTPTSQEEVELKMNFRRLLTEI